MRTTLAAMLAMALALALHVDQPALAVVFTLARGTAGAFTMLAGALAGSGVALVLLDLFDQSPGAFSLALLVVTSLATYGALGRRFPYAFIQAELNLLILVGQSLDEPSRALERAFYGIASVLLAALAAFVVGASQPVGVPVRLQDALAAALGTCSALLRDPASAPGLAVRLELLARNARALLAAARPTRQVSRPRQRALAAAAAEVAAVARCSLAREAIGRARSDAHHEPAPRPEAAVLARHVDTVASLLQPEWPAPRTGHAERRETADPVVAEVHADAGAEGATDWSAHLATRSRLALARLASLATLLPPGPPRAPAARGAEGDPQAGDHTPAQLPAFDRFRARHSVKAGASYLLILWAWAWAGWGAIVPALVVAVLVATLATPLGASLTKATLRVGGVLVGGCVGLAVAIVLLPLVTSLPAICLLAGASLLPFLLVQQRHERLAFAGLQGAIAFTLTLVHGPGPPAGWREPLDNLIGLAFGIGVVVLVMHAVWPIDATTSAHRALARLLRRAGRRLVDAVATAGEHDAGERRADAADMIDREHAAGFVHEVALYGSQFGRPAERLEEVFLLVAEAATTLTLARPLLTGAAPQPFGDDGRAGLARRLEHACACLAREVEALPGTGDAAEAARVIDALARELVAPDTAGRPTAAEARRQGPAAGAELAAAAGVVAVLLARLLDVLRSPPSTVGVARRAA